MRVFTIYKKDSQTKVKTYIARIVDEIETFQDMFYQYIVNAGADMSDLRHTSIFINQLSRADFLFLNMNILDGFELIFNFKNGDDFFFSIHTQSDLLSEMKHGLTATLREVAGIGKVNDIKQTIKELIERTRELKIQEGEISPE